MMIQYRSLLIIQLVGQDAEEDSVGQTHRHFCSKQSSESQEDTQFINLYSQNFRTTFCSSAPILLADNVHPLFFSSMFGRKKVEMEISEKKGGKKELN